MEIASLFYMEIVSLFYKQKHWDTKSLINFRKVLKLVSGRVGIQT